MKQFECNRIQNHRTGKPTTAFHLYKNPDGTFTVKCWYSDKCGYIMKVRKVD